LLDFIVLGFAILFYIIFYKVLLVFIIRKYEILSHSHRDSISLCLGRQIVENVSFVHAFMTSTVFIYSAVSIHIAGLVVFKGWLLKNFSTNSVQAVLVFFAHRWSLIAACLE